MSLPHPEEIYVQGIGEIERQQFEASRYKKILETAKVSGKTLLDHMRDNDGLVEDPRALNLATEGLIVLPAASHESTDTFLDAA